MRGHHVRLCFVGFEHAGPAALVILVLAAIIPIVAVSVAGADPGDLDPTFGTGGTVVSDFGGDEGARGVAVQPDGRIVVAGTGCGGDFLVARYDADGSPDPTFGMNGFRCIDIGAGSADQGEDMLLVGDGRMIVAGTSEGQFALVRLDGNGNPDPSFGSGGKRTYAFDGASQLRDAALAPDGGVVMVGETTTPGCATAPVTPGQTVGVGVVRTLPEGAPDPGFDFDGRLVVADTNSVQRGLAVAVQPDGAVVVGGRTSSCSRVSIDPLVFRLTAGGAPDPSFAAATSVFEPGPTPPRTSPSSPTARSSSPSTPSSAATQPAHDDAFTVVRYNTDGTADPSFDGDGAATALFGEGTNATPAAVALQGGDIVVGGSVDGDFALARFNPDGTLDTAFGGDGTVVTDLGGVDAIAALAVQADDKLVAAGHSDADVALARYGTTTTPSTSTSTTSVSTTTSTTTPPLSAVCALLDSVASIFANNPFLQPFVALIDALRPLFGCA